LTSNAAFFKITSPFRFASFPINAKRVFNNNQKIKRRLVFARKTLKSLPFDLIFSRRREQ